MDGRLQDTLTEFLQASIHQILYTRGVYPREAFERTKLFDISVYCEYSR